MAKNKIKKQSNRTPAKLRYKVEKRVRDHNKKLRRDLKKKPNKCIKPKVIKVPNICPYKEDILKEVEALRKQKEEQKQKVREAIRLERLEKKKTDEKNKTEGGLVNLVANAQARGNIHNTLTPDNAAPAEYGRNNENSLKAYYKEFKKVVEAADVVLEIVDARDPLGTRCLQVEQAVTESPGNKRLVIVVNKADLVPREILDKWLKHLRKTIPAIPFKASTQLQSRRLGQRKMAQTSRDKALQGSACVGAELLMSLLANYCRNKEIKTSIRVGVVGLPNVGKSSVINSLKRSRACGVGATPGVTKAMQEVQLDSKIKLLDSPGIVFATGNDASASLRNAVRTTSLDDPVTPANAILQRVTKQQMMEMYDITEYNTPDEFYSKKAARTGKFKKGGIPDAIAAARGLLDDWNLGKIKYYTVPPEDDTSLSHISAAIVTAVAKEFDLDSFETMETDVFKELHKEEVTGAGGKVGGGGHFVIESLGPVEAATDQNDTDEMEDDDEEDEKTVETAKNVLLNADINIKPSTNKNKLGKTKGEPRTKKQNPEMEIVGNQQLNKVRKLQFKKEKKLASRREKVATQLSEGLENFSIAKATTESYNFETDFAMK